MNIPLEHPQTFSPVVADCWNRVGVRGDSSCAQLERHVHCRNCPVYTAAAAKLLDADPPADYLQHWTRQVSQPKTQTERDTLSVLIFRIGQEWLALPTGVLQEIASLRAVHSLPHRRDGVLMGLVNIRGELLVCVSLQRILGLDPEDRPVTEGQRAADRRLLVLQCEGKRVVCPADEVHGIRHFQPQDSMPAPATVARAATAYTRSILDWNRHSVGLLDAGLLFSGMYLLRGFGIAAWSHALYDVFLALI